MSEYKAGYWWRNYLGLEGGEICGLETEHGWFLNERTAFAAHPFLRDLSHVSNARFVAFLLQLGHLSAEFVRWYERAKQGFESEAAKEVVRQILRDEIPQGLPTHQDDRLADLLAIGVPKKRALNTPASLATRGTLCGMYRLIRYPQAEYDLRVLVSLRIFGELCVGETYRFVVPELERRFNLGPVESRFFWPHYQHDQIGAPKGHGSAFGGELAKLIVDERTFAVVIKAARRAIALRRRFRGQFERLDQRIFRFVDRNIRQLRPPHVAVGEPAACYTLPVFIFRRLPFRLQVAVGSFGEFKDGADDLVIRELFQQLVRHSFSGLGGRWRIDEPHDARRFGDQFCVRLVVEEVAIFREQHAILAHCVPQHLQIGQTTALQSFG